MSVTLKITAEGDAAGLRKFRQGMSGGGLVEVHGRIAKKLKEFVSVHVAANDDHATATRLGATPTGHMAKLAKRIEAGSDATHAVLRIPRKSRLRAAFGGFTITPGNGKKYLTIPAHKMTYGKRVAQFPEGTFAPRLLGRYMALVFRAGPEKGRVAYWLKASVVVKEDRTLLPFEEIPQVAQRVASAYIAELTQGGPA